MAVPDATSHEASSPIPIPDDFPVTWEQPEDERLFWQTDRMHFSEPVTPMMVGWTQAFNEGFKRASPTLELPIRLQYQRINTYGYTTTAPMVPPEQMEAQGKRAEEKLGVAMGRLWESWDTEYLPEVKEHLAHWEAFDLRDAPMPELLAHLEDTWARLTRLWDIHFLVVVPLLLAISVFDELYGDLFGNKGALDSYRLLQGLGNKTVEGGHALWGLSRKALASSEVRTVLEENDPADVPAALERSAEGRALLAELGAYLEEYGQRSDIFVELGNPNWIENPATAIKNLKDFITQPDRDLGDELAALATQREQLIGEARERLKGYPQPVVEQFESLLKAGQAGSIIQEDHNHWIDQRAHYKVRQVLLEFGRRIAEAGVIEQPDDVFYLTPEELRETAIASPQGDRRKLVAQRKAEMDHFRTIQPPPALGTMPSGPAPDDSLSRAIGKFWGAPPQPSTNPNVLQGNASSPGKVSGTAKVVLSLAQAGKLQPGDIMVAPATMPAWTPLFASIAAVVTDAGGALSHAAIVAREYNIPAVLGTGTATAVITDGQTLEVNGDAGEVRIVT